MSLTYDEQSKEENARYEPDDPDDGGPDNNVYSVSQYELISLPNDFNIKTIIDFIESNVFLPGFQRNYVWKIKRASRLIESVIVGLPIPQIFLYEQEKNKFSLIDGQQRLMSIYYFRKGRFPKKEMLYNLKSEFIDQNQIDKMPFSDDKYFIDFRLDLSNPVRGSRSKLHKLKYDDLDEETKSAFDMRTIRNVVVRQTRPNDHGFIYEIFSRLNSGGVNLNSQEIRRTMFPSNFLSMLYDINVKPEWRRLVGAPSPDLRAKDVEVLLRGCAMLVKGKEYKPSLVRFLNDFSRDAIQFDQDFLNKLQRTLVSFLEKSTDLPNDTFYSTAKRFSPPIFESIFATVCAKPLKSGSDVKAIHPKLLNKLKDDFAFKEAAQYRTASAANVKTRLARARIILANRNV